MIWLRVLTIALCVACVGCVDNSAAARSAHDEQAALADSIADGANASLPLLHRAYDRDGDQLLYQLRDEGGYTQEQVKAELQRRIKDKWAPIWNAWESLKIAQNGWAAVLESGGDSTAALSELKSAYCELMAVWPQDVVAVPLAALRCPE